MVEMSLKEKTDERRQFFPILGTIHCWDPSFPSKCSPSLWQLWRGKEDLLPCIKLHRIYYWKEEPFWEQAVISSSRSKGLSDPWTLNWNLLKLFCMLAFPHSDCSPVLKMAIIKLPAVKQSMLLKVKNVAGGPCDVHIHINALHCLAKAHPSPCNASHATYPWNSTAMQQPTTTQHLLFEGKTMYGSRSAKQQFKIIPGMTWTGTHKPKSRNFQVSEPDWDFNCWQEWSSLYVIFASLSHPAKVSKSL